MLMDFNFSFKCACGHTSHPCIYVICGVTLSYTHPERQTVRQQQGPIEMHYDAPKSVPDPFLSGMANGTLYTVLNTH